MKKKSKVLIMSAIALFGMTVAVMPAFEHDSIERVEAASSYTLTKDNTSSWATPLTVSGISYGGIFSNQSGALMLSSSTGYFYNETAITTIKKITLVAASSMSGKASWYVTFSSSAALSSKQSSGTETSSPSSGTSYSYDAPAGTKYFCISNSSSKSPQFSSVTIEYESAPASPLSSISVSSSDHRTFLIGSSFVGETITGTFEDSSESEVSATYFGYDMNALGTQTVTASVTVGNVTKTTTYEITVKDYDSIPSGNYTVTLDPAVIKATANGNHKILEDSNGKFYNSVFTVSGDYTYQGPSGSYPSEFKFAASGNKNITFSVNEEGIKISSVILQLNSAHPENFVTSPSVNPSSYTDGDITSNGYEFPFNATTATLTNTSTYNAFVLLMKVKISVNKNSHNVTNSLTNASFDKTGVQDFSAGLSGTITADTGYNLPSSITMTLGGNSFTNFTYNNSTGAVSIASGVITESDGDLVILGTAAKKTFTITNNLTNVTSSNTTTTYEYGSAFETTLSVPEHFKPATVTVTMGGVAQTGAYNAQTGKVSIASVTGNIVITASSEEYAVTGVTLDQQDCMLAAGGSISVEATVSPADVADDSVTWTATPNGLELDTDYTFSQAGNVITLNIDESCTKSGSVVLTATANGNGGSSHSASITITITNYELTDVAVTGTPVATQYTGHDFDYTGLSFAEVYNDGKEVNPEANSITGEDIVWDELVAGQAPTGTYTLSGYAPVKITISGVTVVEDALASIAISGDLNTKSYYSNVSAFDLTGLTVSGTMISGAAATIDQKDVTLTPNFTPTEYLEESATKLTVTASYGGKTATIDITGITVTLRKITKLEVKTKPKTDYTLGEDFNATGLVVKATYNDGTTDNDFKGYDLKTDAINKFAEGTYVVNVELEGALSASFMVTYSKLIEVEGAEYYQLVTNASDLNAGDKFLIVGINESTYYGMKPYSSGNNCGAVEIPAPSSNKITFTEDTDAVAVTLGGSSGSWTFFDGTYYLYAAGGTGSNHFKGTTSASNNTAKFTISIGDGGVATVKTIDSSTTRNTLKFNYNNGSPLFSCYNGGQLDVYLYKQVKQEAVTASLIGIEATTAKTFEEGQSLNISDLTVQGLYNSAAKKAISSGVTFSDGSTSKTLVAGENTFELKYTVGTNTFTTSITVNAKALVKVSGITVTGDATPMFEGETQTLTATVAPSNASNKAVEWESSDDAIATVNKDTGVVTAKAVDADGKSVTITATAKDGSGVTGTFTVYVDKDDVNGYTLYQAPDLNYKYGDTFSAEGLVIKETYDSGKTTGQEIAYNADTASKFTLSIPDGTKLTHDHATSVSVTYDGFTIDNAFTLVVDKVGQSLEITNFNSTVYEGQDYILGDSAVATVTYSDSSTGTVNIPDDVVVDIDTSTPGDVTVSVTINGLTDTFTVTVLEDKVSTIALVNAPDTHECDHGETFDPTGLIVTATYLSGNYEDVYGGDDRLSYDIETFDTDGNITLTITFTDDYGETATTTTSIKVNRIATDATITSAEIYKDYDPSGTNTPFDGDIYQTDNITVKVVTSTTYTSGDNTTETNYVTFESLSAGTNTKTISVNGFDVDVTLNDVKTVELSSVSVDLTEVTTTGYIEGQTFDPTGIVVNANYTNQAVIPVSSDQYTIDGPEKLAIGENTFTVSFDADGNGSFSENEKTTFVITAAQKQVSSIELVGTQEETYFLESELSDIVGNGYQVKVNYDNGTDETIDIAAEMVSINDGVVTITYAEKTDTYDIVVLNKDNISSITIGNTSASVTKGDEYTFNPGTVTAHYENTEKTLVLGADDYTVDAVVTSAVGKTTYYVIVKNTDIKASFDVTVNYAEVNGVAISGSTSGVIHPEDQVTFTAAVSPENANQAVTWASSDETIATVENGVVTFHKVGSVTITATSVQNPTMSASVSLECTPVPVESVSFKGSTVSLDLNETQQLEWTINPENAANTNVTFTSSDTSVATVDENGLVTAVGIGEATITVTTEDGQKTNTCLVFVDYADVTGVSISGNDSTTYRPGQTVDLDATVAPENANDEVTWSSSDESIATVDENGVVTFIKEGSVTITATSVQNTNKSASVTLSCQAVHVQSVSFDGSAKTVTEGETVQLSWTVNPTDAQDSSVTFISSDESVATVDANGLVTTLGPGTATITIKTNDGNKTDTYVITVKEAVITVFDIERPGAGDIYVNETVQLDVYIEPTNVPGISYDWSSDNEAVATVDENGLVTAKGPGEVTILCVTSDGKHSATIDLTIVAQPNNNQTSGEEASEGLSTGAIVGIAAGGVAASGGIAFAVVEILKKKKIKKVGK